MNLEPYSIILYNILIPDIKYTISLCIPTQCNAHKFKFESRACLVEKLIIGVYALNISVVHTVYNIHTVTDSVRIYYIYMRNRPRTVYYMLQMGLPFAIS